jgi:hypothetical protein
MQLMIDVSLWKLSTNLFMAQCLITIQSSEHIPQYHEGSIPWISIWAGWTDLFQHSTSVDLGDQSCRY